MGPECQSLGLTAPRQRPLSPCPHPRPHRRHFPIHRFPAATLPSFTASGGYKERTPPTVEHPFFLLRFLTPPLRRHSRHRRAAADSLLWPLSDHFDQALSTAPPCTTSLHPETSTTTPGRRPTTVPLRPTTPCHRTSSSG
jgi:hypothetical protein